MKMGGVSVVSNAGRVFGKSAGQGVLLGGSLFRGGFGVFPGCECDEEHLDKFYPYMGVKTL